MKGILAVDSGTTACKAAIVSMTGRILGLGRVPIVTVFGTGGRAQQDPHQILTAQRLAIREAVTSAGRLDIVAAGFASQRSTFVIWDPVTGRSLVPAPTWQDTSSADRCLARQHEAGLVRRLTGLPLSPHYSASKISRSLRQARRAGGQGAARLRFGSVATWLLWNLTREQVHATDHTHAARSLLMNLRTLEWDKHLLSLFQVPRAILPQIRPCIGSFGTLRVGTKDVPVLASLGDQQAALFSMTGPGTSMRDTSALVNYGTGAFVVMPIKARASRHAGLLSSVAWTTGSDRRYLVEGTVNAAGAALDWLRREFGAPERIDAIDALCRKAQGDCVMVPAFWRLGSMHHDEEAGLLPSVIIDPAMDGSLSSLTRAAVESLAFLVDEILAAASAASSGRIKHLVLSGPLSGLRYLAEFQAALAGPMRVEVSQASETTLVGIARAAACGLGGDCARSAMRWSSARVGVSAGRGLAREAAERRMKWVRTMRLARRFGRIEMTQ